MRAMFRAVHVWFRAKFTISTWPNIARSYDSTRISYGGGKRKRINKSKNVEEPINYWYIKCSQVGRVLAYNAHHMTTQKPLEIMYHPLPQF